MKEQSKQKEVIMKNSLVKYLVAGAAVACLGTMTVQAIPITGNLGFTGSVQLDTPSAGTATQVTAWQGLAAGGLPAVQYATGSFAGLVAALDPVTFVAPWSFVSGPVTGFWTVDGFQFDLLSSYIDFQSGSAVSVKGTGTVSGNGFDSTVLDWSFTSQNPGSPVLFTFSASANSVPDGGTTVLLLGLAMGGLGFAKRYLTK
jgi:hypothetical protein